MSKQQNQRYEYLTLRMVPRVDEQRISCVSVYFSLNVEHIYVCICIVNAVQTHSCIYLCTCTVNTEHYCTYGAKAKFVFASVFVYLCVRFFLYI